MFWIQLVIALWLVLAIFNVANVGASVRRQCRNPYTYARWTYGQLTGSLFLSIVLAPFATFLIVVTAELWSRKIRCD